MCCTAAEADGAAMPCAAGAVMISARFRLRRLYVVLQLLFVIIRRTPRSHEGEQSMRPNRAALATGGTALAAVLLSTQPTLAAVPLDFGCLAEEQIGSYLSKDGSAKATFSTKFLAELERAGIRFKAVDPIEMIDGGTAVRMPIGERYDNIE